MKRAVPEDRVSEELRAVEREVDAYHLASPLIQRPFAQASWYFLAFCEELVMREIVQQRTGTAHELAALADNIIVHAKWPLRWLRQACSPGGAIPRGFDDNMYEAAWRLSELSMKYLDFEAAFTSATSGLVTLTLDGSRIKSSGPMRNDGRFDAYDRFAQDSGAVDAEHVAAGFLERVAASVRVRGSTFDYDLNPQIVQAGLEALGPIVNDRFSLPTDWELPRFTLREFAQVARVLWIVSFIHFQARVVAALSGCEALGYSKALVLMDRDELVRRIRRYSGVRENAVRAIVGDLTYGAREQANPDPALQPIVPLSASTIAMSPNLIMNSSMERNLAVLLNRFPEERRAYSALSQGRETRSRERLITELSTLRFRFWSGQVPEWMAASDVDLVIVSDAEKQCLILQLKSFIAPAEPREIMDRSEEIQRGIGQVRDRMDRARDLPGPLHTVLGIDSSYGLSWAVASDSSVGASYVQDPGVPVVNTRHLSAKLRRDPELARCCRWLEGREYLPVEGLHYKEIETEAMIGRWTLEWYGIKAFTDDYMTVV